VSVIVFQLEAPTETCQPFRAFWPNRLERINRDVALISPDPEEPLRLPLFPKSDWQPSEPVWPVNPVEKQISLPTARSLSREQWFYPRKADNRSHRCRGWNYAVRRASLLVLRARRGLGPFDTWRRRQFGIETSERTLFASNECLDAGQFNP
jgi:hypothetical protein